MHVGHGRGAVFGDALATLLDFAGYKVTREYYINDAGAQVDVLARSAYLRYREALGEEIGAIPEGLYPGDYLKPVGEALAREHGPSLLDKPEAEWLPLVREASIDAMMDMIRDDLAVLNIHHDVFFSERSLQQGNGGEVAKHDRRAEGPRSRLYGPPAAAEGPEGRGLGGPGAASVPGHRVRRRGRPAAPEVGRLLHLFRLRHRLSPLQVRARLRLMIDVWGADHGGYVKRMQAAVKAVTDGKGDLDVKLCQLVKLLRGGEPVKMSKRSGDFVTLREVVDEVGRDAVRFMMIFRKNDATLDFDLAKVVEQSKDNPVFYVQYAHARCASVFRQAAEAFPDVDFSSRNSLGRPTFRF